MINDNVLNTINKLAATFIDTTPFMFENWQAGKIYSYCGYSLVFNGMSDKTYSEVFEFTFTDYRTSKQHEYNIKLKFIEFTTKVRISCDGLSQILVSRN